MGRSASGEPARFQEKQLLAFQPWRVEERQRHARGLARAWRSREQGIAAGRQRVAESWQDIFYWESVHARVCRHEETVAEADLEKEWREPLSRWWTYNRSSSTSGMPFATRCIPATRFCRAARKAVSQEKRLPPSRVSPTGCRSILRFSIPLTRL